MKANGFFLSVLVTTLLAGCASNVPAPVVGRPLPATPVVSAGTAAVSKDQVQVKRGDTLYSIAREHQLDVRELAAWNQIDNPSRIAVGQSLRIKPPGTSTASGEAVVVTRPIGSSAVIESRPLDGRAPSAAPALAAPVVVGNQSASVQGGGLVTPGMATDKLKREPRVGKIAYSDEAWAKAQGLPAPAASTAAPATSAVSAAPVPPAAQPAAHEARPEPPASAAEVSVDDFHWIWPVPGKLIGSFSESGGKGIDLAGKAGEPVLAAGSGKVVYSGTGLRGYGKLVIVKHNATYLSAYAHNQNILVKEGQSVTQGQKIAEMGNTDADRVKLHFEIRRQGKPVDPARYLPRR